MDVDDNNNNGDKFSTPIEYFVFGCEDTFRNGITKRITPYLNRSIEEECTTNENSKYKEDYIYVVYVAASEVIINPRQPHRVRDKGHAGMTLSDFTNHFMAKEANLTEAEVAVCRMYTGPFYIPWNNALRYYDKDPTLFESWQSCISVLHSAVLKLSYLSKKGTVYCGVNESKLKLHERFYNSHGDDFSGGVALAFMSTTYDENVAIEYARRGSSNERSIFVIQSDMANRGASLQWLSQYSYENEKLYNPCTCLTTDRYEIKNGIKYIYVRASVCIAQPDVDRITKVKLRSSSSSVVVSPSSVSISSSSSLSITNEQEDNIPEGVNILNWNDIKLKGNNPREIVIGEGSFGMVLKAEIKMKMGYKDIAVKIFNQKFDFEYEEIRNNALEEAKVLASAIKMCLNKDGIVNLYGIALGSLAPEISKFYGLQEGTRRIGLVTRYEAGGTLEDLLHPKPGKMKPELKLVTKLQILLSIVDTLRDLHANGVIHGDLKPANILLDSIVNPKPRLADFGLSAIKENIETMGGGSTLQMTKHTKGTRIYCAPEMLPDGINNSNKVACASRKTDMYALALVAWEIFAEKRPFYDIGNNEAALCLKVHNNERPSLDDMSDEVPPDMKEMIKLCWDCKRQSRLMAVECYSRISYCHDVISSNTFDIFLSHAWIDKRLLCFVYANLTTLGFRVWYDLNQMQNNIEESMKKGIDRSMCVVACVNRGYEKKKNCMFELKYAFDSKKTIIPIFLDNPWGKEWPMNDDTYGIQMKEALGFPNMMFCDLSMIASDECWKETKDSNGSSIEQEDPPIHKIEKLKEDLQPLVHILSNANCYPSLGRLLINSTTQDKLTDILPPSPSASAASVITASIDSIDSTQVVPPPGHKDNQSHVDEETTKVTSTSVSSREDLKDESQESKASVKDQEPSDAAEEARKKRRELAKQDCYDIKKYPHLRSPDDFVKGIFLHKAKVKEEMMVFQPTVLHRSLLVLADAKNKISERGREKLAIQMHKDLLGYMGDLSLPFPCWLAHDILTKGFEHKDIRDEIYTQIIKQLSNNPNSESIAKGWHMMCMCVGTFPPSYEFENYLFHFIIEKRDKARGGIVEYARYCLRTLEAILSNGGGTGFVPSVEEIQAYKERPPILATIYLVDNNVITEDLPVTPDLNVSKIIEMCVGWLELRDVRISSLGMFVYDLGDTSGQGTSNLYDDLPRTPRPLRSEDFMGDIIVQKTRQKRKFKFVLKKKIFIPRHNYRGDDPLFEKLVYLQAEDDTIVQGNIVIDDAEKVSNLVALAMAVAYGDKLGSTISELVEAGLRDFIPPAWRDAKSLEYWGASILDSRDQLVTSILEKKDALVTAETEDLQDQFLQLVQESPLYGTHWFYVHNRNMDDAPEPFKSFPYDLLLGFNHEGMHLYTLTYKHLVLVPYSDIVKWGGSTSKFCIILSLATGEYEFTIITAQAPDIAAIILDNISAVMEDAKIDNDNK